MDALTSVAKSFEQDGRDEVWVRNSKAYVEFILDILLEFEEVILFIYCGRYIVEVVYTIGLPKVFGLLDERHAAIHGVNDRLRVLFFGGHLVFRKGQIRFAGTFGASIGGSAAIIALHKKVELNRKAAQRSLT